MRCSRTRCARAAAKLVEVRDVGYEVVANTGRTRAATPRFRRLSSVNAESHRGASSRSCTSRTFSATAGHRSCCARRSSACAASTRSRAAWRSPPTSSRTGSTTWSITILERRQYSQRPPRYEYRLTQKGRDLFPHALMLMQWGDAGSRRGGPNLRVFHKTCGARLNAVVACSHCHKTIDPHDVTFPPVANDAAPAGRAPPRVAARSFAPCAASKSCFNPIASIICARS